MKRLGLMAVAFCMFGVTMAQTTPERYFDAAPRLPKNCCTASSDEVDQFNNEIERLAATIRKDADSRTEALQNNVDVQSVSAQYMGGTGLTAEEIAKIQSGNISDAEAAAIAARVAAQGGGKAYQPSQQEQGTQPFKFLLKYAEQSLALSNEQEAYYKKNILPIEEEESPAMVSVDAQDKWDSEKNARLRAARKTFCEIYTPKRIALVESLKTSVKSEMENMRKYEAKQLGVVGASNQDIILLNLVLTYLDELKGVLDLNVAD